MRYYCILFILFEVFILNAQADSPKYEGEFVLNSSGNELKIAAMNCESLDSVFTFKKFELGVNLPDSILNRVNSFLLNPVRPYPNKINPFLEWELDVDAVFIHSASKTTKRIEGFYYRNFKRNYAKNNWDDIITNYPMRIRFSPTLSGEWTLQVNLKVKGKLISSSSIISFNVKESNSKGYVSVHPNQRNLQRNGEMIYPIGHNFFAPTEDVVYYHNAVNPELKPNETHKAASLNSWIAYYQLIENYFKSGGEYIRTIQTPASSLIEFEEKGNYFKRLNYAWEQDYLIELCEEYDGLMLFNLMLHTPIMNFGDYYFYDWDWGKYNYFGENLPSDAYPAYCYNDNPGIKEPHEMFLLENDLLYHEQRTRYYIARYGYSTSIYEFEILSEPFHLDQFWKESGSQEAFLHPESENHEVVLRALNNYHTRIANYIKDTLEHHNQLIGVNTANLAWQPDGFSIIDSSLYCKNVDIIGINPYATIPSKLIISKSEKNGNNRFDEGENSYARMIHDYYLRFNKPIIFPEGGPTEEYLSCSNYSDTGIDNQTFSMLGVAGHSMWNGFREEEIKLWASSFETSLNIQKLMVPVLSNSNGAWIQGRQKAKNERRDEIASKETNYYISEDQNSAVGYVRNLTYNFYTQRTDDKCSTDEFEKETNNLAIPTDIQWDHSNRKNRLKVEGLSSKTIFIIEWYDRNELIEKSSFKSNRRGSWVLEFPELSITKETNQRPLVWFKIRVMEPK